MEKKSFHLLLSKIAFAACGGDAGKDPRPPTVALTTQARAVRSRPTTISPTCTHEVGRGTWTERCPVAGRRPSGLLAPRQRECGEVAAYLARAAHLEAASVFAFDKLAEDLESLGAPDELVEECLRAAREEAVHARIARQLAAARDASPPGVDVLVRARPTLLELALENVSEGVVRESYGALQATFSGRSARAPDVRKAMATIAVEEASHAWLALRIAAWLDARLSKEERTQVAQAKDAAIRALRGELEHEPAFALRHEVGVPSRVEALTLFDQLARDVWQVA